MKETDVTVAGLHYSYSESLKKKVKFTVTKDSQQCLGCQANLGIKVAHLMRPKNESEALELR